MTKVLRYSFYLLFGLTPLIWTSVNSELFEYNKIIFVYLITVVVLGAWVLKMLKTKKLNLAKTPLDIPLLIFWGANLISTIFSIDKHISVWGYYSRSNGGLLSITSYLILYYALASNFKASDCLKFLRALMLGGLLVSLWAIPEHFGVSPSCVILTDQFNATCWVQDVQSRVFATLGQPNWLAAYLSMLIFPAVYFFLSAKRWLQKAYYLLLITIYYLAFTFTYSRGATLGLLAGLGVFSVLISLALRTRCVKLNRFRLWGDVGMAVGIILIVSVLFGTALTQFSLIKKFQPAPRPAITTGSSGATQLENGGTESGKIRLIVWKGAWEIFKHYPVFGSGVETFAYSYYQYRPKEHNLTSEWDFLYNKAHNEFLNYLATTGFVGLGSYLLVIFSFQFSICFSNCLWQRKQLLISKFSKIDTNQAVLLIAILSSYIANAVTNFFGFSVVTTNLLMYLFPALVFVGSGEVSEAVIPESMFLQRFFVMFIKKLSYLRFLNIFLAVFFFLILVLVVRVWIGDFLYARGSKANEAGSPGRAYGDLSRAVSFNPFEPLYKSELSFAAAGSAVAIADQDATISGVLKAQAESLTKQVLDAYPRNVSLLRTAIRSYYLLSNLDKNYNQRTLELLDKAINLAPTDPKLRYNKAIIEGSLYQTDSAIEDLRKTIELKMDYRDAHYGLGLYLFQKNQKDEAIAEMRMVLKIVPEDAEASQKLKEWVK